MAISFVACQRTDVAYYDNGIKKHEINYKGDQKDGICKWWYENGTLSTQAEYKDGKLNGKYQKYTGEAIMISSQEYVNDLKHGLSITYNKNGDPLEQVVYRNDTLHGHFTMFHENGTLKITGVYNQGLYDSIWIYRNDENLIVGRGEYKNGTGVLKSWFVTGQLTREVNYVNNLLDGVEIIYNEDGTVQQKRHYKEGVLQTVE